MISSVTEIFNRQIYGRKFLAVFERIAYTITGEYIEDIHIHLDKYGCPPSFEERMSKVRALTNELTMRAKWIRDEYKEGKGYRSVKLTTGCKRIIKKSVNDYLTQIKYLDSISRSKAERSNPYADYRLVVG